MLSNPAAQANPAVPHIPDHTEAATTHYHHVSIDRFEIQKYRFYSELTPIQIINPHRGIKLGQTPIPTPNSQVLHGLNNKRPYQHKTRRTCKI